LSRLTTVAANTGVNLPVAVAGLDVVVINHGANPVQVYGNNTAADKIDDVATGTGVSQMANSFVIYACTVAGNWYSEGLATGFGGPGLATMSFAGALTAGAAGQSTALALTNMINRVSTVASGTGVALPTAVAGLAITVINRGANPLQVYGNNTAADTINGIATGTGISQGVNTAATYVCSVTGNWEVPLTSLQSTFPIALSANGAIPPHTGHTYVITKAGSALVDTLAAPTATTDDGIEITITSNTAFAHTVTATGLFQTGSASVNLATFAASAGAGFTVMAYQGKWNVLASVGVTFT
jgi:hypothetical protein